MKTAVATSSAQPAMKPGTRPLTGRADIEALLDKIDQAAHALTADLA